jgi:hypothetical protein
MALETQMITVFWRNMNYQTFEELVLTRIKSSSHWKKTRHKKNLLKAHFQKIYNVANCKVNVLLQNAVVLKNRISPNKCIASCYLLCNLRLQSNITFFGTSRKLSHHKKQTSLSLVILGTQLNLCHRCVARTYFWINLKKFHTMEQVKCSNFAVKCFNTL